MAENSPIRVWITGGTLGDREHVRSVLRDQALAVLEDNSTSQLGSSAEIRDGDRTAAERAVRESQRLISIGRLSAEIVHEINNPLESVGNLLYLALHEPGLPERATDYLRTADSELQRVVQISKQTLSFSRESADPVPLHLTDLMDEVINMYSRRIRQKQLVLVQEYSLTHEVVAIPGEIRQVFSNLVTNAIEACAKGGKLHLRIRDSRLGSGGNVMGGARITVSDNGTGIPEAARKRIGEIFFTTKGESGTGLGLWVTKAIVARHGGTMRLRSSTGKRHGTAFSIFLPVAKPVKEQNREATTKTAAGGNVTEISRHPRHANHLLSGPTGTGPEGAGSGQAKSRQRQG